MKKIFILLSFLFSINAFATGRTTCEFYRPDGKLLVISFAHSHMIGNPILANGSIDVSIDDICTQVKTAQIVNYKNIKSDIYMLALDDKMEEKVIEMDLVADGTETDEGQLMFNVRNLKISLPKINFELTSGEAYCTFE